MPSWRRWWMDLFRARRGRAAPDPVPDGPRSAPPGAGGAGDEHDDPVRRAPTRRYSAPPAADDPLREAQLGAVLQALAAGPRRRAELGRLVGAADWGPGRLDTVVDHGISTGVLLGEDDGTVRARYAD